eukprot:6194973-Pleurochrysis_carterae.AAC.1
MAMQSVSLLDAGEWGEAEAKVHDVLTLIKMHDKMRGFEPAARDAKLATMHSLAERVILTYALTLDELEVCGNTPSVGTHQLLCVLTSRAGVVRGNAFAVSWQEGVPMAGGLRRQRRRIRKITSRALDECCTPRKRHDDDVVGMPAVPCCGHM